MDEKVLRTIRDYVATCGGQIPLQTLEEDFEISYGTGIPYERYGYSSVIELLTSIPGIFVKDVNGEYQIETLKRKLNLPKTLLNTLQFDDISTLCVEMNNNLLLGGRDSKRKVTVSSQKPFTRTRYPLVRRYLSHSTTQSEENVYEKCFSPELTIDKKCRSKGSISSLCSNENADSIYENSYYSPSPDMVNFPKYSNEMNNFYSQEAVDFDSSMSIGSNLTDLKSEYENGTYYEELIPDEWLYDRYQTYESKRKISENELINRLVNVINLNQKSSTSREIELRYFHNYSDELPKNWLNILEKSLMVFIENLSAEIIIYPNRMFLGIPSKSLLPKMQYPDPKTWNVIVTAVTSITSIWFRLCDNDYDSKFDILTHEMNKHYDGAETCKVTSVKCGELYAVCMNANVVRVEVTDSYGEMITCSVIDIGIVKNFNVKCLFVLHEKFINTCPLALQGSLTGLEKYEKYTFINCKLRNLILNKKATAVIDCFHSETLISFNLLIIDSPFNVSIYRSLLDEIEQNFSLPELEVNEMYDVYVLSVGEDITRVQVVSRCYKLLQQSLNRAKEIIDADEKCNVYMKSVVDIQLNEMYLVKYTDGTWQRIIVQKYLSAYEVEAMFIDFKEVRPVNVRCIVNCFTLPDTLTFIPPQAIDVKVVKNESMILNFLKQIYKTNVYSIKVIENNEIPVVEMYLKLPNNANVKPIASVLNMININGNVTPMYSMW